MVGTVYGRVDNTVLNLDMSPPLNYLPEWWFKCFYRCKLGKYQ